MIFNRTVATMLTLSLGALPLMASEDDEYRKAVVTFITLNGHECGSVLEVAQREEPNAFDVVCSENENGGGEELSYFFQLSDAGAVVEPQ